MIIGAGLAGMIAGFVFPQDEIIEARSRDWVEHQAVLRFRTPAVSELTGIPFRQVTVRKGIWTGTEWTGPNVQVCNQYSRKTIGRVIDRSIWDISTAERWVAPGDLRERLADALGSRIRWETPVNLHDLDGRAPREPVISTVPMSAMSPLVFMDPPAFRYAPITTIKLAVLGADVFQTVYFPSPQHSLYRASITGDMLICEWASESPEPHDIDLGAAQVARAFGIPEVYQRLVAEDMEPHVQQFGKIAPIDELTRRRIVLALTQERGIYSLGRFATWRNLLLDDVVHDAHVIKRLMTAADDYDRVLGRPLSTRRA